MQLIPIMFETYQDKAPAFTVPVVAYGMSYDEERIVMMVYEDDLQEAA